MASRRIEDLHVFLALQYRRAIAEFAKAHPTAAQPFITSTYRSNKEQDELYAQGRTKPGKIITNAKGGQSLHNYLPSYAFDIAFVKGKGELDWDEQLFKDFADIICRNPYVEWGGNWKRFKDRPHFQFKDYTWQMAAKSIRPKYQFKA